MKFFVFLSILFSLSILICSQETNDVYDYDYSYNYGTENGGGGPPSSVDLSRQCIFGDEASKEKFKTQLETDLTSLRENLLKLGPIIFPLSDYMLGLTYNCSVYGRGCLEEIPQQYRSEAYSLSHESNLRDNDQEVEKFLQNFNLNCVKDMIEALTCPDISKFTLQNSIRSPNEKKLTENIVRQIKRPLLNKIKAISLFGANLEKQLKESNQLSSVEDDTLSLLSVDVKCIIKGECLNDKDVTAEEKNRLKELLRNVRTAVNRDEAFQKFTSLPMCCMIPCGDQNLCDANELNFLNTANECQNVLDAINSLRTQLYFISFKRFQDLYVESSNKELGCLLSNNECEEVKNFLTEEIKNELEKYRNTRHPILKLSIGCFLNYELNEN